VSSAASASFSSGEQATPGVLFRVSALASAVAVGLVVVSAVLELRPTHWGIALVALPLLVAMYFYALNRKKKLALRYASLTLVKEAMGAGQKWRRHVPPLLFLLALLLAIVATARPTAVFVLPSQQQTIVLAIDVSRSMRATDVEPNRITAAQAAAKSFIDELPKNIRVGVVSFAGTAAVVQTPTHSRDDLLTAIDRFQLQRGTATGSGLLVSLALLLPNAGIDLESIVFDSAFSRWGGGAAPIDRGGG